MARKKVETKKEYAGDDVRRWLDALEIAGKDQEKWETKGDEVIRRYRDEDDYEASSEFRAEQDRRFNILWSNVETLKPALYSQTPQPVATRRFKDEQDPLTKVARKGAMVLEKALEYHLDVYDFDGVLSDCRDDYLLPGRAVARIRYIPTYGKETTPRVPVNSRQNEDESIIFEDEDGNDVSKAPIKTDDEGYFIEGEAYRPVVYEEAHCEYVYWKDFRHGWARRWKQVPWVAFRSYLTRKQLIERFGDKGRKVDLDFTPKEVQDQNDIPEDQFKKGSVWEIWSKVDNKVYWVAPGYKASPLDERSPPLKLRNFFPCTKPLIAVGTNDNLRPIPEYHEYIDQAEELDTLTQRISSLTKALQLKGVYDAQHQELQQLLRTTRETELIGVESWAAFAEKGGLKGAIDFLPIEDIARVLISLYEARDRLKQDLYEITGLADIIRGASNAQETATAQRIKGQFASLRLRDKQKAFAKFAREAIELKAEVIAEHFSAQTLQLMTGMQIDQQVMELLRDDAMRNFRIDIETDSTILPDEQADKQSRIEFLETAGRYIASASAAAEGNPSVMPLMGQMLLFAIRGFRVGRELEEQFEETLGQIQQQPQQQGPDPQVVKEQAEMQMKQQQQQFDQQLEQKQAMFEAQLEERKAQQEAALETQKARHEMALEQMLAIHRMELEKVNAAAKARTDIMSQAIRAMNQHIGDLTNPQGPANEKASLNVGKSVDKMGKVMESVLKSIEGLGTSMSQNSAAMTQAAENFAKPRVVTLESGLDSGKPTALSKIVPETMQ